MDEVSNDTKLALIVNDMAYLKESVHSIDLKLDANYVTKQEFDGRLGRLNDKIRLLNRFMYGTITVICLAVAYAILGVVGLGR
jgi:hypothetical protein